MAAMMTEDVTAVCGPKGKHDPARAAVRYVTEKGSVTLGGRRASGRFQPAWLARVIKFVPGTGVSSKSRDTRNTTRRSCRADALNVSSARLDPTDRQLNCRAERRLPRARVLEWEIIPGGASERRIGRVVGGTPGGWALLDMCGPGGT